MSKAERISHLYRMIRTLSASMQDEFSSDYGGYLTRLERIAADGGFITSETEEAIGLKTTANELRNLADRIMLVRESLIVNEKTVA